MPDKTGVEAVLAKVGEVAVLPQVVYKIMEMTGSSEPTAQAVESQILVDPGFASKVLATANSAHYALPKQVTSIREAVMYLGFKAVRQLAMAVGVFDLFVGKTDRESLRRRAWWRHSLDTAVCCRGIAPLFPQVDPEEAYTCGLLHLIGKTLMDRSNPEAYHKVEFLLLNGASDQQAEFAVFGCTHGEVNAAAARMWGFPQVLVSGVDYQREPDPKDSAGRTRAHVALCSAVAQAAVDGEQVPEGALPEWVLRMLLVDQEQLTALTAKGRDLIAKAAQSSTG